MSYHGLIPAIQRHLTTGKFIHGPKPPKVLEVGTDRGVTLIPLAVAMASAHNSFLYLGVDVNVQESLSLTLKNLGDQINTNVFLHQANSLDLLPKLIEQGMKFDVILLDGDHNYHTVAKEMTYLDALLEPDGFAVIDDYDGKWSERDLWYADRPGYEDNQMTTKPVDTDKHGVKPAVDEWLEQNPIWQKHKPMPGEPIVLARKKNDE